VGPLSKPAQVVLRPNLRTKPTKPAKGFDNHVFEGKGDAFLRKNNQGNTCSSKPQHRRQNLPRASATPYLKARVTLFRGKESKKFMLTEALVLLQKTEKVQSQCMRVTLLGESVRINDKFGSLGVNLVCEGLLLGMGKGGHKEIPMKLYLTHWTFINIMTINNFVVCFVGRENLTQR
jgi:hypothetical protein